MPIELAGRFQPIQTVVGQATNFIAANTEVSPFYEVTGNPQNFPLSIEATALQEIQHVLEALNTRFRITTVEGGALRGVTHMYIRFNEDLFPAEGDVETLNYLAEFGDGVPEYLDIDEYKRDSWAVENNAARDNKLSFSMTSASEPEFLIEISVKENPPEGLGVVDENNNPQWTVGALSQVLLHEIHFHVRDFSETIHHFYASTLPLDHFVLQIPEVNWQHGALVGSAVEEPAQSAHLLESYRQSRARFFVNCNNTNRQVEWNNFATTEHSDCVNNNMAFAVDPTNSWWGTGNQTPNPTPEYTDPLQNLQPNAGQ